MIPREHKKAQLPYADLAVFIGAIAFLAFSVHSFLGAKVQHPAAAPPPAPLERSLASEAPVSVVSGNSTQVLHLPCLLDGPKSATSHARLMQIHAAGCAKSGRWRAVNDSSGEEILIFENGKDRTLSTNYFNLQEGRNALVFTLDLGHGNSRKETVIVVRE